MIANKKPTSKTLTTKKLIDILSGDEDHDINVIENIIQRELVWDYACIETFWYDVLECIRINHSSAKQSFFETKKVFDKAYTVMGNIEVSTIDVCNKKYLAPLTSGEYRSIVDGSQRNRISMLMVLAFMYIISLNNNRDMDLSSLKNSSGVMKLTEIGEHSKLNEFYKELETTSIENLSKKVDKLNFEKLIKKLTKEDEERDYFTIFALFVKFIERDIIGTYDVSDALSIVMHNVYFYEEIVSPENKFERFVDRNKKGTPMSDEQMYPKYIINQFSDEEKEKVYSAFNRFKVRAIEIQGGTDGKGEITFRQTKNKLNSILYIMIEALKISLGNEHKNGADVKLSTVFASTFNLGNIEYGVEKCFSKGLVFRTSDDAIKYFNMCYDIADFLGKDSFSMHENIIDDYYYLRDFGKSYDVIWWYYIKPSYIIHSMFKDCNYERYKFMKQLFYRLYAFYVIHISSNTNSQNFINLLEQLSREIIMFSGDDNEFKSHMVSLAEGYINKVGGYNMLRTVIPSLAYNVDKHKNALKTILLTLEYDMCEKFNIPTKTFYSLWRRKRKKNDSEAQCNLDHWYPENKFKGNDDFIEYHRLGNLVLLEESLNKSKQDDNDKNVRYYTQSKYTQTLLMSSENRGVFRNSTINELNKYPYLCRYNDDIINEPTLDVIRERTKRYEKFFIDFIKDFIENNKLKNIN